MERRKEGSKIRTNLESDFVAGVVDEESGNVATVSFDVAEELGVGEFDFLCVGREEFSRFQSVSGPPSNPKTHLISLEHQRQSLLLLGPLVHIPLLHLFQILRLERPVGVESLADLGIEKPVRVDVVVEIVIIVELVVLFGAGNEVEVLVVGCAAVFFVFFFFFL